MATDNDLSGKMGLNEQTKFDVKAPLRGQTGDNNGQRPVQPESSVKTDRGSFKVKG